jgi:polar amino acid transport system permease protein
VLNDAASGENPYLKLFYTVLVIGLVATFLAFVDWGVVRSLNFGIIWEYREPLWGGLMRTLLIVVVAIGLGLGFGTVMATLSQSPLRPVRWLVAVYVELWRNTPLLVQIMWVHFALPFITGVNTTPMQSGLIAITLQAGAYFTEIVRAGIEAIHRGQWEAAYALAIPKRVIWGRIILPQAARIIIPPLASLSLSLLKATAILSILQISELMTVAKRVSDHTFHPIELMTFAAAIYLILGYAVSISTMRLERLLRRAER